MTHKLDQKDMEILAVLKEHGDYTTRQIAKKTNLPTTTIYNRIKKLREEGVIRKFTIDTDPSKTDKGFLAYILISANLQMLKQKGKTQYDLAEEIRKLYFVERVDIVSGHTDLLAIVRVKDVEEFDKVLLGKLQIVESVDKTESLIVIHGK